MRNNLQPLCSENKCKECNFKIYNNRFGAVVIITVDASNKTHGLTNVRFGRKTQNRQEQSGRIQNT